MNKLQALRMTVLILIALLPYFIVGIPAAILERRDILISPQFIVFFMIYQFTVTISSLGYVLGKPKRKPRYSVTCKSKANGKANY